MGGYSLFDLVTRPQTLDVADPATGVSATLSQPALGAARGNMAPSFSDTLAKYAQAWQTGQPQPAPMRPVAQTPLTLAPPELTQASSSKGLLSNSQMGLGGSSQKGFVTNSKKGVDMETLMKLAAIAATWGAATPAVAGGSAAMSGGAAATGGAGSIFPAAAGAGASAAPAAASSGGGGMGGLFGMGGESGGSGMMGMFGNIGKTQRRPPPAFLAPPQQDMGPLVPQQSDRWQPY